VIVSIYDTVRYQICARLVCFLTLGTPL